MGLSTDAALRERIAGRFREDGRLAEALPLYAQAAELTEAADPTAASRLWNNAGVCALTALDQDRAVECFRNAIHLIQLDQADSRLRLPRLYANLTAALYHGSRIREAWDAGRQALLLAEETDDPGAVGAALYNLALAERYLGEFGEALKLFTAARGRYTAAGAASRAADALHNAGWVRLDRRELAAGEEALRLARAEKLRLGELPTRIDVELTRLMLLQGDTAAARRAALRIAETGGALLDRTGHVQTLLVAAEAARHDDLPAALQYAGTALAEAAAAGRPPVLLDLLPLIVRLRSEAEQPLSAEERSLAQELYARRHGVAAVELVTVEVHTH